jgi:thermitase
MKSAILSIAKSCDWRKMKFLVCLIGVGFTSCLSEGLPPQLKKHSESSYHEEAKDKTLVQSTDRPSLKARDAIPSNWGWKETDAIAAWKVMKPGRQVVVAVIDTGIDINHPDLNDNLWSNQGEIGVDEQGRDRATNGVDDDANGFVDDVHGWNFASESSNLNDQHGHGTHIAGIIAATGRSFIRGIAPHAKLMVLKYFDPERAIVSPLVASALAIKYAVHMGADVINYSGGGKEPSEIELQALSEAAQRGVLVVAAAGNEKANSDHTPFYPADYELENILSVSAIDEKHRLLETSNWGKRSVDIAAPGHEILSTLPQSSYGEMTGTSQATAFASGVAALLIAHRPTKMRPEELIQHLVATGVTADSLFGKTREHSILNSYRSLAIVESGASAFGAPLSNRAELEPIYSDFSSRSTQSQ